MQLLVIDVQNSYRKHCQELIPKIPEYSKKFSQVFYLIDTLVDFPDEEIPEEFEQEELLDEFYSKLHFLSKEYGFLRSLMDLGIDEDGEEIIKLARFMLSHNILDSRMILEDKEVLEKYQREFKNSSLNNINLDDYPISLPDDLIDTLREKLSDGVVLIGGGRNECLKEISLLLKILDIKHTIDEEMTY